MQEKPQLSIITVNLNNREGLKKTMQSVFEQTWQEFEFIIIDGGSTDGSREYIEQHKEKLSYWVSEPDKGIYNAMNKGIDKANGEYLLFLNSGDSFNNKEVLKNFSLLKPFEDIIYGNSLIIYPDSEPELKVMPSNLEGMTIFYRTLNHQSVFHNKRIFEKGKRYNEEYEVLADWVLYNEVVLFENGSYRHIDLVIADYDLNGFSSKPENKAVMQRDRNKFYAANIDFFINHLIQNYEDLKGKNKIAKSNYKSKYYKAFVLFKKSLRMIIKGY
ncbi:glycosyltransferase [Salegentibacter sp. JZCK2]|uniref:glycosyltransferase family 2 protein n=1 Tax=Salegentibacter tibetensis TaxID=2873600 RepID=UPI001CD00A58|nr:glycosyltransferase family 2 protein [Salegentibacter tibetensis]MBZ9729742.1 glycosyltransferase [Salegentibacter tibetensis]